MIQNMKALGSIAARPRAISKRPPEKVCVARRYQDSQGAAIDQRDGPASDCWAGPKDCGLRAAGAQVGVDTMKAQFTPNTLGYDVLQNVVATKTPTERTAGALACVVDTESKFASRTPDNITARQNAMTVAQKDARMRGAPRAEFRTWKLCSSFRVKSQHLVRFQIKLTRQVIHHICESEVARG